MDIGARLRELRLQNNACQKEIASLLNVTKGAVSHYETNKYNPDPLTLCKIADYYGVPIDYIFGRTDSTCDIRILDKKIADDFTYCNMIENVKGMDQQEQVLLVQYIKILRQRSETRRKNSNLHEDGMSEGDRKATGNK